MAVLVMLNNYLHDLATAVFAVSAFAAYFLLRSGASRGCADVLRPVVSGILRVGFFALAWTLAGGMVRMLAYRKYEWIEAVGRAQVPALIVKHVILVALVTAGVITLLRVRRVMADQQTREGNG